MLSSTVKLSYFGLEYYEGGVPDVQPIVLAFSHDSLRMLVSPYGRKRLSQFEQRYYQCKPSCIQTVDKYDFRTLTGAMNGRGPLNKKSMSKRDYSQPDMTHVMEAGLEDRPCGNAALTFRREP